MNSGNPISNAMNGVGNGSQVQNNSSVSSIKKSGKSGRKTYSTAKREIVEMRKNSVAKV